MDRVQNFRFLLYLLPIWLAFSGCRGLDDDNAYAISTKASFFLVKTASGLRSIYQYRDHGLVADWNAKAGLPNAELSDAEMVDNELWLASGPQKALIRLSPTYASAKQKFDGLPLAPHYLAVGSKQIMVADTAAHLLALVHRKRGMAQLLDFDGKPGPCLYNSGTFYVVQNDSMVAIYDETAMTSRVVLHLGMTIDELLLTKYHGVVVMGHDSAGTRQGLIDVNGFFVIGGVSRAVPYQKFRPTAYFAARFGEEYLADLYLNANRVLNDTNITLVPRADDLEADFFEGTVFYTVDGHFVARKIATGTRLDSIAFQGQFLKSMHQYVDE